MSVEHDLLSFILILTRVSSFVAFLPLFAQKQLPVMVKAGLSVALTLFWFGSVGDMVPDDLTLNIVTATLLLAKEAGIGYLLATVLGLIFVPAKIAGAYVGQEIGLSLASVTSPNGADSSTLVTMVFETLAVLLFFGMNLHHFIITMLHVSMVYLSGKIDLLNLPTELLVESCGMVSEWGILIVAPVAIGMFVLTVGLALLNKAAPALNLFSVGMSLRSGLGLVCMLVFLPVILKTIEICFGRYQADVELFLAWFE